MFIQLKQVTQSITAWSSNNFEKGRKKVMPDAVENKTHESLKEIMCPNCNELRCLFMGNNFIQCRKCLDLYINAEELLEVYNEDNYFSKVKHGKDLKIVEV